MFFVLIITKEANDEFTQVVFRYDTYKQARSKFFTELAYDLAGRKACSCTILNQGGSIIKQDAWDDSEA